MLDFLLKTIFLTQITTASPLADFQLNIDPTPLSFMEITEAPQLDVKAAAVMDLDSNQILFEHNAQNPLPIASLTKIMTAIITLENTPDLDAWMMIPDEAIDVPGNKIWFYQFEKLKIKDILAASLIKSGNDATMALAIQTGGSEDSFVEMMNSKAKLLGLKNTHFRNPVGFDDDFHFSTAHDLLILTKYALQNPIFREIVATPSMGIWSFHGLKRELYTTNKLMTDKKPGDVFGVKTGTTEKAGQCLVLLRKNSQGSEILSVVLGANDRWFNSKKLTDWIYQVTEWH